MIGNSETTTKKRLIQLRITPELHQSVIRAARLERRSITQFCVLAIEGRISETIIKEAQTQNICIN